VSLAWVVPLGGQLDLLAGWLEPIVDRPGLAPVAAGELQIVLCNADPARDEPIEFEPFDALVGPVRVDEEGVVAGVIPLEPFIALRALVGADADYEPRVIFATSDGTHAYDPMEAVATEAVYVRELTLVELS
jgi:hypothetical protein